MSLDDKLDAWVNAHFEEEVRFHQALVHVPTPTPPGDSAPHAERTAKLLQVFGFDAEKHPVPAAEVQASGLQSLTNLIVRRNYRPGITIALNAPWRRGTTWRRLDARPLGWRPCGRLYI